MIAVAIFVTEFERLSLDLNQFHLVGGAEADIGALAGVDVANDCLDECAQIAGGAMMHLQHNGRIAVVFDCHSFAKIVCRGHGKVASY